NMLSSLLKTLNSLLIFFFQADDGIRDATVTGVQTCALPISTGHAGTPRRSSVPCGYQDHATRSGRRYWSSPWPLRSLRRSSSANHWACVGSGPPGGRGARRGRPILAEHMPAVFVLIHAARRHGLRDLLGRSVLRDR